MSLGPMVSLQFALKKRKLDNPFERKNYLHLSKEILAGIYFGG